MESIAFQTQHSNYYLYSPSTKTILPLPKDLYDIISNGKNKETETLRQLREYGYIDDFTSSLDACITGQCNTKCIDKFVPNHIRNDDTL